MLDVKIYNTSEGSSEYTETNATYRYCVFVNDKEIARGEISGHNREDGWAALVLEITLCHLTPRALDGLYCPHCGELLSEHVITERGGYCQPARK